MDTKLYEVVKVVEKPSNVGQHFEEYKRQSLRDMTAENYVQKIGSSI